MEPVLDGIAVDRRAASRFWIAGYPAGYPGRWQSDVRRFTLKGWWGRCGMRPACLRAGRPAGYRTPEKIEVSSESSTRGMKKVIR